MSNGATTLRIPPQGGLMSYDFGRPAKYYMENVARNPLLMSLIQGAGGYMLGKHVGAPLLEWMNPSEDKELEERRRKLIPWMGAAAGALPAGLIAYGRMLTQHDPTIGSALTRPFKSAEVKEAVFPLQPGTRNLILMDPILSPYEKAVALNAVNQAAEQQGTRGLMTTGDLVRGAIGAGMGYLGAKLFGKILGLGFNMPPQRQKTLGRIGILGGILGNTGVLRVGA